MATLNNLPFNNTFYRLGQNQAQDQTSRFYTALPPQGLKNPYLVSASQPVADLIGLDRHELQTSEFIDYFSGTKLLSGSQPLAMVYSGHQFGSYNPQLGDGRALLLGEVESPHGRFDLNLKGAGMTPYSRMGDGRAVLRSSIREYLCSEAMAGLGIPTTRALSLIGGEDEIVRETIEPSAVVCRVASSHLRFGNFEWFYHQKDHESLQRLTDYVIEHHFPLIHNGHGDKQQKDQQEKYALFFQAVVESTANLIAQWQSVGFCHGVMNTDNMSILGLTFDYGPFAFMDDFEPGFICNHSDYSGRYAFNQQPPIGLWNLQALAQALTPLIKENILIDSLNSYQDVFGNRYQQLLAMKLGLVGKLEGDTELIQQWLDLLAQQKIDYTIAFRALCHVTTDNTKNLLDNLFPNKQDLNIWFTQYTNRLKQQSLTDSERQKSMRAVNPKYILRNYLVQNAIELAQNERDFSEVNNLLELLYQPFDEQPEHERYAAAPPESGKHLEISCSS